MTTERSFGRIIWRDGVLGFHMVNADCRQFFIYADPLIGIVRNPDSYYRVKRRTLKPGRNGYPGEIYGDIEELSVRKKVFIELTLHFGSADRLIKQKGAETESEKVAELLEVVEVQKYLFPKGEFMRFFKSIEAMRAQRDRFDMLMRDTEILPPP